MKILPGLIRENGYDYKAIEIVFDIEDVRDRQGMFNRILKLIDVIDTEKKKRTKK